MSTLAAPQSLATAAAVCFGNHGDVTRLALTHHVSRQRLYRETHTILQAIDGQHQRQQLHQLRHALDQTRRQLGQAREQLRHAVVLDRDKQQCYAATAQAGGVSLAIARDMLAVFLGEGTPSPATLGRYAQDAGRRATAALEVLDPFSGARARQLLADEIFSGAQPILMTVEPHSLCWLGGRRAARRDGQEWAQEFRRFPQAQQLTCDRAQGLRRGLTLVNAERQAAGQAAIADQSDHFHPLRRAYQGLTQFERQAKTALEHAERLQKAHDKNGQRGVPRTPKQGWEVRLAWAAAQDLFDRWSAQERVVERLRTGLHLFTPEGLLNTPQRAQAEIAASLAALEGPGKPRVERGLGPEAVTFLQRVAEQLQTLAEPAPTPADATGAGASVAEGVDAAALVKAAVRVEGLSRQKELLRGEGEASRSARGLLVAASVVLSLAGEAGARMLALVRGVLRDCVRASSLVEGVNSVVRMHQGRQKRLTQGLLDLKRLYWNLHTFRAGKRKKESPYGRLGVVLPEGTWWDLLKRTPEQLQKQMSALNPPQ